VDPARGGAGAKLLGRTAGSAARRRAPCGGNRSSTAWRGCWRGDEVHRSIADHRDPAQPAHQAAERRAEQRGLSQPADGARCAAIAVRVAYLCVPAAAGPPSGASARIRAGRFGAASSGPRMSVQGRHAKLSIATPMRRSQLCADDGRGDSEVQNSRGL